VSDGTSESLLIMLMSHYSMLYDIINSELLDEDYHFAMLLNRALLSIVIQ
jgi:hypothetical protein